MRQVQKREITRAARKYYCTLAQRSGVTKHEDNYNVTTEARAGII